jgi:hypothetical protein
MVTLFNQTWKWCRRLHFGKNCVWFHSVASLNADMFLLYFVLLPQSAEAWWVTRFSMLIMVFDTGIFALLLATEVHINVCSQNHIFTALLSCGYSPEPDTSSIHLYSFFPLFDYSYTLKMEAESSSRMLVPICHSAWPHFPRVLGKVHLPLNGWHILWPAKQNVDLTFKNLVPTSQKTHCISITKTNWLMLFREIITVYCENHTEHTNTLCGKNADFFLC